MRTLENREPAHGGRVDVNRVGNQFSGHNRLGEHRAQQRRAEQVVDGVPLARIAHVRQDVVPVVDGGVVVGDKVRVVARAPGDQFPPQPRVFIHLQHVNAHVRHAGLRRFF